MRQFQQALALLLVADAAGDVEAGRIGGDDGVAGFEQKPGGHGRRLAVQPEPGDLHQQRLSGREALALLEKAGTAIGQAQDHAALALERPVADPAQDGADAGAGLVARVDQQVVEPPVHHQRGGAAAIFEFIEQDDTALHDCLQTGQPAAARS